MPIGELAALASALTFSFTAIVDKALTRRLKPLTLGSFSTLGGTLFALLLLFSLGKASELPDAPVKSLLLTVAGGVVAIGIGMPFYLVFLRSVDVSKASPMTNGLFALVSVVSGLVILGEDFSIVSLLGFSAIVSGVYMLSISQRRQAGTGQSQWLGFKGVAFLLFVVSMWVTGTSLQKVALEEIDVVIANSIRLPAVFLFLATIASSNMAVALGREKGGASTPSKWGRPTSAARLKRRGLAARGRDALRWGPLGRVRGVPARNGTKARCGEELHRIALRVRPPVFPEQISELEDSLSRIGGSLHRREKRRARGGSLYYLDLPAFYAPEETLAAMPSVAGARRIGHWPGGHRIEVALRMPSEAYVEPGRRVVAAPGLTPRVRYLTPEAPPFLPFLLATINGCFSYGLASLLMLFALQHVGLATTAVLSSTQLLWIALLSTALLRERLTLKTMTGIVVTAAGVVLVVL